MTRYHRQVIFEPFGEQGQQCLARARVLICGCGALGGNVAAILARAGVGFLRLVDDDSVSLDNLHRQFLFNESDAQANVRKVDAAAKSLHAANSEVAVEPVAMRLTAENTAEQAAAELIADVDLLADGTDNFPTRFLLNELALRFGKPLVSAGVEGASGQVVTVIPGKTPCLGCLFDRSLLDSKTGSDSPGAFPILSPTVQIAAAHQAMAAIKILSGHTDRLPCELLTFDLWANRTRRFPLAELVHDCCDFCRKYRDGEKECPASQ